VRKRGWQKTDPVASEKFIPPPFATF
jgi:hypothetical protein